MNAGDQPVIGSVDVYKEPGVYTAEAGHFHLVSSSYLTNSLPCIFITLDMPPKAVMTAHIQQKCMHVPLSVGGSLQLQN